MGTVIDDDVYHIFRGCASQYCHGTHVHQHCAVTVHAPYFRPGLLHCHTQGNAATVSHGAYGKKIILMALSVVFSDLEQFSAGFTCGAHNRILTGCLHDMADDFLTDHWIVVVIFHFFLITEGSLPDYERYILTPVQFLAEVLHGSTYFLFRCVLPNDKIVDSHILQQFQGHFTLVDMLRFVVDPRLATPADDEDHRDGIDFIVQQRRNRVDDIAFSAVLHIHYRGFAGGEVISGSQCCAVAFVSRDHMMLRIDPVGVHQVIAEGFQLGIRYSGIKIRIQDFCKIFYFHIVPFLHFIL